MFRPVLFFVLLIGVNANAQFSEQKSLVTVRGVGEIQVAPDEVSFDISINNFDKDPAVSRSENERRTKAVISVIQHLGIDSKDYKTSYIAFEPRYRENNDARQLIGYASTTEMHVKLRDISKAADLSSRAISAGATELTQIQFTSSKLISHRAEARALALKAAKEKAGFMADQLGQKIGRAFSIVEGETGESPYNRNSHSNSIQVSAEPTSIAAGVISIREQITVSFELN